METYARFESVVIGVGYLGFAWDSRMEAFGPVTSVPSAAKAATRSGLCRQTSDKFWKTASAVPLKA